MAEAFGASGVAFGIAGAFNNAIEYFEYIQLGRNFSGDFQTALLRLDVARVRLSRWGASVKINDSSTLIPKGSDTERNLLYDIVRHLTEDDKVSSKYNNDAKNQCLDVFDPSEMDQDSLALHKQLRDQAKQRQKAKSSFRKAKWALHDKKQLDNLIENIMESVRSLEDLYPGRERGRVYQSLAAREVADGGIWYEFGSFAKCCREFRSASDGNGEVGKDSRK